MSSDVINMAGKTLIVDDIKVLKGEGVNSQTSAVLAAYSAKKAQKKANSASDDASATSNLLSRVGARINANSATSLDVYCYSPRKSYSTDYTDDYYVQVGYVKCNNEDKAVGLTNKYQTFALTASNTFYGTWAISIYKNSAADTAFSVRPLLVSPNGQTMRWIDVDGNTVNIDQLDEVWIIGSFNFSLDDNNTPKITNLFISLEGLLPFKFLKNRFMDILNDASGTDTTDFYDWAVAMNCDAIFRRLAAIEAFINLLKVNNLEVGGGSSQAGFFFQAKKVLTDDGQGNVTDNSVFDVYYGGAKVFSISPSDGNIYFGSGFYYQASDGTIRSANDGVVIDNGGFITINRGLYKSDLSCPSFCSLPKESASPISVICGSGAESQYNALINGAGLRQDGSYMPCVHSGNASVKYIRLVSKTITRHGYTGYCRSFAFYGSNLSLIGEVYYVYSIPTIVSSPRYVSDFSSSFTATIGTTTTVAFKLIDPSTEQISIGTSTNIEKGELYYEVDSGGDTGTLHIKL